MDDARPFFLADLCPRDDAMLDAFGLAFTQAAGTMQAHAEGKPTLAFAMGNAARAGIQAVDLAAAGFPGPHDVLDGPFGYFRLMEGQWDAEPGFDELGSVWRVTQLSHKPFPSGRATHGGLDAIQRLMAQHGFAAEHVERVTLLAPPLIHQLVGRPFRADMSVAYARLCFPFAAATMLASGNVDIADFRPARFAEPAMRDLAERNVVVDENPDPNALAPLTVRVHLRSGAGHAMTIEHALGSPANPLSREQRLAKFRRCWTYAHPAAGAEDAERLIELVEGLDSVADVTSLVSALPTG
jgi:2-methylcitrate dehydratase PrpD